MLVGGGPLGGAVDIESEPGAIGRRGVVVVVLTIRTARSGVGLSLGMVVSCGGPVGVISGGRPVGGPMLIFGVCGGRLVGGCIRSGGGPCRGGVCSVGLRVRG